jgi:hypothetical protein
VRYPLSPELPYTGIQKAAEKFKQQITGFVGGSRKSEAKSASSRAKGTAGGGRPPGS